MRVCIYAGLDVPTKKGLEMHQIYLVIDVTTRNKIKSVLYGEVALPAQHILNCCELMKQRTRLVRLPRHYSHEI